MDKLALYNKIRALLERLDDLDSERKNIKFEIEQLRFMLKCEYGKASSHVDKIITPRSPDIPSTLKTRIDQS